MKEIKTKEFVDAQEVFEGVTDLGDWMHRGLGRGGDYARNLADDGQVSSNEYASNLLQDTAKGMTYETGHIAVGSTKRVFHGMHKNCNNNLNHKENDATNVPRKSQPGHTHNTSIQSKPKTDKVNMKSAQSAGKATIKTAVETIKDSPRATKAPREVTKAPAKIAHDVAEAGRTSTHITAAAAHKSIDSLPKIAHVTAEAVRATAKVITAAAKAVVTAVKEIGTAIAAGGWVALLIIAVIIIILIIIMAVMSYPGSSFGAPTLSGNTGS